MPVIGLKFGSFSGKREKELINEKVNINSTPRITEIKETSVPNIAKKVLSFSFEFITAYEPDVGVISVTGDVLFVDDNSSKILSDWKKKKELPADISTEVLNFLFRRCLLKISNIAEDLQLPPPIGFPKVKPTEKQETDYVG